MTEPTALSGARARAQVVYVGLSGLFILGVWVAFFLAGEGIFGLHRSKLDDAGVLDPHRAAGNALGAIALLLLITALVARATREQTLGTLALALLAAVAQPLFAGAGNHFVAGLHVLTAGVILALAFWLHLAARKVPRG